MSADPLRATTQPNKAAQSPSPATSASASELAALVPATPAPAAPAPALESVAPESATPALESAAPESAAPAPESAAPAPESAAPATPALAEWPANIRPRPARSLPEFSDLVRKRGRELYRDLPWRRTQDPYAIWISEVMLQQTQVARVDGRWQRWLDRFPTVEALAAAPQADVLAEWQGMGYNRRALALLRAAQAIVGSGSEAPSSSTASTPAPAATHYPGDTPAPAPAATRFPRDFDALVALPGIGPATAAGIRAFAFNLPGVYLETNVRTVFLHELFPHEVGVPDRRLTPLIEAACPDDARSWYYALLDYGAWLKKTVPNPSRRSRTHTRQSSFEGSHRQKRAMAVRALLDAGIAGITSSDVANVLSKQELAAGRDPITPADASDLLSELAREGFCHHEANRWFA